MMEDKEFELKEIPEKLLMTSSVVIGLEMGSIYSSLASEVTLVEMSCGMLPEVAWCGLTETEARKNKQKVNISRFPWAASGRAQSISKTDGITKIICDPDTERILGMGIVGSGAGELITEGVIAVESSMTARELAECVHPHPTLSETVMESAEAIFGQATHTYRKKNR